MVGAEPTTNGVVVQVQLREMRQLGDFGRNLSWAQAHSIVKPDFARLHPHMEPRTANVIEMQRQRCERGELTNTVWNARYHTMYVQTGTRTQTHNVRQKTVVAVVTSTPLPAAGAHQ